MKLLSVNVGLPREVQWRGKTVMSSIWKHPVEGRVACTGLNLDGDRQSDLDAHGGARKAVYVYPYEHYSYWRDRLPGTGLPLGAFGENFTTAGLLEDQVRIGDRFRAGLAEFVVTQPRMPCYKLAIRLDRADMVKQFLQSRRTGFYLAVFRVGEVAAGDPIEFTERRSDGVTVAEAVDLYTVRSRSRRLLRRALESPALPDGWKERFRRRLS